MNDQNEWSEEPKVEPTEEDEPQFSLLDYKTGDGPGAQTEPEPTVVPYTDEEIATITGAFAGWGLPPDVIEQFHKAYVGQTQPILAGMQTGEALAELGIHKGDGIASSAPAWLRCAVAGTAIAVTTFTLRRQFSGKGGPDEADSNNRSRTEPHGSSAGSDAAPWDNAD